jgi:hypothetical protein
MTKQEIIEKILQTLQRQKFNDWYSEGGRFDLWISGENPRLTKDQIKEDISALFGLTE